jgi:hypothetical protein
MLRSSRFFLEQYSSCTENREGEEKKNAITKCISLCLCCFVGVDMMSRVEGWRLHPPHVTRLQVDYVHVRRFATQLLQQLEHVEVGAEVFLVGGGGGGMRPG